MSSTPQFLHKFQAALETGTFVKLTLSQPRNGSDLKNVYGRVVELRGGRQLSLTYRHSRRDETKNHPFDQAIAAVAQLLESGFGRAHLFTTGGDWQLRCDSGLLKASRPAFSVAPEPEHDRRKSLPLADHPPFLHALGITNASGEPRPGMGDKLKQIQRFVEILGHLLADSAPASSPQPPQNPQNPRNPRNPLQVLDMGAGKGYLTFATYEFLRRQGIEPQVTGVELRPELVELTNRVAGEVGFEGLEFVPGRIGEFNAPQGTDLLLALHACDTATDDAIFQGISAQARWIVTAPCCHKEVRAEIHADPLLQDVLRHGILLERQAEMLTDAIRALLLEIHGYKASVFEFISTEHTGKNVMIAATRRSHPGDPQPLRRRLKALVDFYGIRRQHLATLLGEPL